MILDAILITLAIVLTTAYVFWFLGSRALILAFVAENARFMSPRSKTITLFQLIPFVGEVLLVLEVFDIL